MIAIYLIVFHRAQCLFEKQCSTYSVPIEQVRIFMKIVSATLGGGFLTLCLPTPGT